ncbi:hypothetical protein GF373_15895 [bacterium]|nr:hypothetical protein [bacterium]
MNKKNENTENKSLNENSEEAKSSRIRANYSMEEIQKLLADIGATVSSHKAEQIGIDPENMVKTIRGGRIVWITVEEMNAALSKQRKVSAPKKAQRSVRGNDSVSNEISRRVEACRSLIHSIRKVSPEDSPEFTRSLRTLESLQNLSVSQAREVRVLESAIQRKKQEDPILQEMDKATEEMMAAMKEDNHADVDVCQSFCDRHMDEYLARQKRLDPYIKKAKEYRLSFLLSKQQLFQFQYELIEKGEKALIKHIEEVMYYDKEGSVSDSLVKQSNEIRSLLSESKGFFDSLTSLTPEQLEEQKGLFAEADKQYLTPLFTKMLHFTDLFCSAWKKTVAQKKAAQPKDSLEPVEQKEEKRMVYAERQEKN